ncbi:hypothetical protein V6N12_031431 [Hibiscus sabdariffa]|uniref:RNase H type-1 domain-containing protein n=1 Tax=Hibiscus sabdariffa TaxID=183260 RepID=A0ABR2B1Y6_9ROSI
MDASSAELLAIREAVLLFHRSVWSSLFVVEIETDCVLCSQWIGDPSSVPDIFRSIVADILQLCEGLEWSIKSIQRSENGTADKLAKSGISRSYPLLRVKP